MNHKVIFILLDGLSFDAAYSRMGYMLHTVEQNAAVLFRVRSELPTLSRPLYEVLMTGTPCLHNGITNNLIIRKSYQKSIFHMARENGLVTAAAAYYWMSELYNRAPFQHFEDRDYSNENFIIQHGKFYFDDAYPDSHLFLDGHVLLTQHSPDFLLIHPMGLDHTGHLYGGASKEYFQKAGEMDCILSTFLPVWEKAGYTIVVTSDHGMNEHGFHGGAGDSERMLPLWIIGQNIKYADSGQCIPQLELAPFVCELLGVTPSQDMIKHRFVKE
jgi:Uncharacterized proteins of the AP superfamily